MKPCPTTSTRPRGSRSAPRRTQASGSTYRRARVVDPVGKVDPAVRPHALGEPAGPDRARRERLAGRLVPGEAALALAAGQVVDERDAAAVDLGDDLVPEHGAGRRAAELLDVRSAEPAGEHARELARAVRLGDLRERGWPCSSRTTARTGVS